MRNSGRSALVQNPAEETLRNFTRDEVREFYEQHSVVEDRSQPLMIRRQDTHLDNLAERLRAGEALLADPIYREVYCDWAQIVETSGTPLPA